VSTPYCARCGSAVPENVQFCSSCDASSERKGSVEVTESRAGRHEPPVAFSSRSNVAKVIWSVISLGFAFWFLYQFAVFANPTGNLGGQWTSEHASPIEHRYYDSFNVGYWHYVVRKTVKTSRLGRDHADGIFLIVFLSITNDDTDASTLPSAILRDDGGREYSSKPMLIITTLRGEDLSLVTLNPGLSRSGYFVFDVPPSELNSLELVLSGGYRSKETATIRLTDISAIGISEIDTNKVRAQF
jgi:hypothetical protein